MQTSLRLGCYPKDAIDPQPDTTAGHVVTQDGTVAGMDTLGVFLCPIWLQKLAMNLSVDTGYLTTV
ncbi:MULTISPECIES: hypothetical protein [unclassified Pseudomonas]|uniref:hypothetical protein n=1 Tax=unclassified Pseudomonas TaxID=196821 RepID=UPI0010579B91|nr:MULTISPECIES: hypothetical protein [unclassified Pseudomonas]